MPSRSELKKELTALFNHYIKVKEVNHQGFVKCFTCDTVCHISNIDAGHFQGSKKSTVRWDEMNVKPQCRKCNNINNGMRDEFANRLDMKYGCGTAKKLIQRANQTSHFKSDWLREKIEYYKSKLLDAQ